MKNKKNERIRTGTEKANKEEERRRGDKGRSRQ